MGHNFFFAYSVVIGMKVPWRVALGAVAIAGIVFVLTAGIGLRERLITAIPASHQARDRGRHRPADRDDRSASGPGSSWPRRARWSTLGDLHSRADAARASVRWR